MAEYIALPQAGQAIVDRSPSTGSKGDNCASGLESMQHLPMPGSLQLLVPGTQPTAHPFRPNWLQSLCGFALHAENTNSTPDTGTQVSLKPGPASLCREHATQPTSCCCAAKRSTASRAAWPCTAPSARSSSSASFTSAALCCSPVSRCVCSACRKVWCRVAHLVPGRHMCSAALWPCVQVISQQGASVPIGRLHLQAACRPCSLAGHVNRKGQWSSHLQSVLTVKFHSPPPWQQANSHVRRWPYTLTGALTALLSGNCIHRANAPSECAHSRADGPAHLQARAVQ